MTQTIEQPQSKSTKKKFAVSRCFKGKILLHPPKQRVPEGSTICLGDEAVQALMATHHDFNTAVRRVIDAIELHQKENKRPALLSLLDWMLEQNANSAHNVLEPLTIRGLKTDRKSYPPEQIENLSALAEEGFLLFDVNEAFPWLKTAMRRKVFQKAVEKIKHYQELKQQWREGKQEKGESVIHDVRFETEKVLKRLKKILSTYPEDLEEQKNNNPTLKSFLEGFTKEKGKNQQQWLKAALSENLSFYQSLIELFDTFGTGEMGKDEWKSRRKQWIASHPEYFETFWKGFFIPLEQLNILKAVEHWGDKGALAPPYQDEYTRTEGAPADKAKAVLFMLDGQKNFEISQTGTGIPFRPNYRRFRDALRIARLLGHHWVQWRSQGTGFQDLSDEEQNALNAEGKTEHKKVQEAWAALEKRNPELLALLKTHLEFKGRYYRFKNAPSKRWPDPIHHPEWLDTQKDVGYRNINFHLRTVDLLVANPTIEGEGRYQWKTFAFGLDSRFIHVEAFRTQKEGRTDKETGEVKSKDVVLYQWHDPRTHEAAQIDIKGIKLLCRSRDKIELVFRYEYEKETLSKVKEGGKTKPGTRTLALDLGQKYFAALTAYEQKGASAEPIKFKPHYLSHRKKHPHSKPVEAYILEVPGLSFKAVDQVQRQIATATRKMTQHSSQEQETQKKARFIVRGEVNHKGLRSHYSRIKDERVRKAASAIVQTALNLRDGDPNRRIVIVHENLTSYKTQLKRERHDNRRLQLWSVQRVLDYIEDMAALYGIMVVGVSPAYTSQVCSRCNHWGTRFNIPSVKDWVKYLKRNPDTKKKLEHYPRGTALTQIYDDIKTTYPRRAYVAPGGDFFCCSNPQCLGLPEGKRGGTARYTVNADINASRNLNRKFHDQVNLSEFKPASEEELQAIKEEIDLYVSNIIF